MQKQKKKHLQPMLMFKMPTAEEMRDQYINTRQDNSLGGGGEIKKSGPTRMNMEKFWDCRVLHPFYLKTTQKSEMN